MSSRKSIRKIALTTNGVRTTNLLANAAVTNSFNLTLPPATPTITGQSLISDTAGNLSWGSSVATVSTFTGTVNPVTTPVNVTGLSFTTPSSQTTVYVALNATTNIYAMYTLLVYQKGTSSSWGLAYSINGDTDDDPGVNFTITAGGQVQYVLGTVAGFSSIVMMWTLGTSISNTLTSLALSSTLNVGGASTFTAGIQATSLALSSTFNVTGLATHAAMSGLSLVLANAASSGSISSTVGTFLSLQNQTYTDSVTAASTTAAGTFSATYLGVPTLAATNTAVTTSTASTLTIAGPPIAGTNETLTNAYALNVLTGNSFINGLPYMSVSKTFSGRWFNNGAYTPPQGWNYLTGASIALAADIPPSINATVGSINTATALNYNNTTALVFLPVGGVWSFNWFAYSVGGLTGSNGYELRLCTFSAPAWPTVSAAKSYGSGQTATQLSIVIGATLTTGVFVVGNESSISYTGTFPPATLIAPLIYSSNGAPSFGTSSLYIEAKLLQPMQ